MNQLRFVLAWLAIAHAPVCIAERVEVPLRLDPQFIESLLRQQLFSAGQLRINDDGSGCQFLELRDPRVRVDAGQLRVRTRAAARAGRAVGDRCLLALDWRGELEFTQQPVLGDDRESIVLHMTSWRAVRADGSTDTASTTVGKWIEQFLPLGLKRTPVSLAQPLTELRNLLDLVARRPGPSGPRPLIDAISIDRVGIEADHATAVFGIEVSAQAPAANGPEPLLNEAELALLEHQLESIDAFFTYTIRHVAGAADEDQETELFDVLVNLRQDLLDVLNTPHHRGDEPARQLFVAAWKGLAGTLARAASSQSDYASALQYLSFLGAGEALSALEQLGPAVGIELTDDGLRRLARMLLPDADVDPLDRGDEVDPELRKALGFGAPLPPPQIQPDASWMDWIIPRAIAGVALDPSMVQRLNNWVPKTRDMDAYLPMVRDVLRAVVVQQLDAKELPADYHALFRSLVFSTAWQESCWRQFTAKDRMRVPVQSGTGDLGIMQINPRVWRGLYDLHGLRWDIVYNARAGADILEHYLTRYALKKGEHKVTGGTVNLARSAYAAYNGGPRRYDRYRRADSTPQGKKIDALFYEKFKQISSGHDLAVTACYSG